MLKQTIFLTLFVLLAACSSPVEQPQSPQTTTSLTSTIQMPSLPDLDFATLNFFFDGYTQVRLVSCTDGDTARFNVNGTTYATRFLAIDTPEISGQLEPWAMTAKNYACDAMQGASQIVLELEPESDIFDNYNRLLAWVWVDGELLQYKLVEESLAYVKYLYGNYAYNPTMIALEAKVQKEGKRIWGEVDPTFNDVTNELELSIDQLRTTAAYGDKVTIEGIVTGIVANNFFLYDNGAAIYVYTRNAPYRAILEGGIGARVRVTGDYILFNGLDEISNINNYGTITLLDSGVSLPESQELLLSEWGEAYESMLVHSTNLTIARVVENDNDSGYDVYVTQAGIERMLRIDKRLDPKIDPSFFEVGRVIDAVGNLSQYVDDYQLIIRTVEDIRYVS